MFERCVLPDDNWKAYFVSAACGKKLLIGAMLTAKMCLPWLLVLINVKSTLMKGFLNGKHLIVFPLEVRSVISKF